MGPGHVFGSRYLVDCGVPRRLLDSRKTSCSPGPDRGAAIGVNPSLEVRGRGHFRRGKSWFSECQIRTKISPRRRGVLCGNFGHRGGKSWLVLACLTHTLAVTAQRFDVFPCVGGYQKILHVTSHRPLNVPRFYSEYEPIGPWRWAKKTLSHKAYNFYDVVQHPFFDQEAHHLLRRHIYVLYVVIQRCEAGHTALQLQPDYVPSSVGRSPLGGVESSSVAFTTGIVR